MQQQLSIQDILAQIQNNNNGFDFSYMNNQGNNGSNSLFGPDGFGLNAGTANVAGKALGGLKDLAAIYFGNKQLGLAEDQLDTTRAFGNRNISNQAKTINNTLEARYRAALAARGHNTDGSSGSESLESYLNRSKVDGSEVGG